MPPFLHCSQTGVLRIRTSTYYRIVNNLFPYDPVGRLRTSGNRGQESFQAIQSFGDSRNPTPTSESSLFSQFKKIRSTTVPRTNKYLQSCPPNTLYDVEPYLWLVVVGCFFGFIYAFGIGANDVANDVAKSFRLHRRLQVSHIETSRDCRLDL